MSTLLQVERYPNQSLPKQRSPASQKLSPSPLPNNETEIVSTLPFMPEDISVGDSLSNASILQIDAASVAQCFDPLGIDLLNTSRTKTSSATPAFRGTESDHIAPELLPFQLPSASDPVPSTASEKAMMEALLRGLGLPEMQINSTPVEFAEAIGSMLKAATAGTMDIFKVHAITRHESRLKMAMLDKLLNNPLNFFLNADVALTHLLSHSRVGSQGDSQTGHLQPAQAYVNAFNDLKAHEIAIMAGIRAALASVVERSDPAMIEQDMPEPTMLDKIVVHRRKARMWDRLVDLHNAIKTDADEDFQRLFGEKFNQAYGEQVQKLSAGI